MILANSWSEADFLLSSMLKNVPMFLGKESFDSNISESATHCIKLVVALVWRWIYILNTCRSPTPACDARLKENLSAVYSRYSPKSPGG